MFNVEVKTLIKHFWETLLRIYYQDKSLPQTWGLEDDQRLRDLLDNISDRTRHFHPEVFHTYSGLRQPYQDGLEKLVILAIDGTKFKIQKSGNHYLQKACYNSHTKGNCVLKLEVCV